MAADSDQPIGGGLRAEGVYADISHKAGNQGGDQRVSWRRLSELPTAVSSNFLYISLRAVPISSRFVDISKCGPPMCIISLLKFRISYLLTRCSDSISNSLCLL